MTKLTLVVILSLSCLFANSQQEILIFKKGNKEIYKYWPGTTIAFQIKNGEWQKGEITKFKNDSFFIRPRVVHYNLYNTDTFYYNITGYSVADIYAFPKPGVRVDFVNGSFRALIAGSHVKWYWIKGGAVFRYAAEGYAVLVVANGIIKNDLSWKRDKNKLLTAAAVYLGGFFLRMSYKPYLRIGRKYQVQILKLSD
jgi:hypothetical protein